jgi:hypothetical protein
MYISEKRAGFAGMNLMSGDAKLMTLVPIVSRVRPRHKPPLPVVVGASMIARSAGTFHENVDNPVDRLRLLSLRA